METIMTVVYRSRTLQFEQGAYDAFLKYEQRLKTYFESLEGGPEAFDDLQYRMAEILEALNKEKPLTFDDVNRLIAQIGEPADLADGAEAEAPEVNQANQGQATSEASKEKKWSFFRSKNEKMIGGVCAGIAQHFAIDPLAVRLIFVLVTLLQVGTLFTVNAGILIYLILWAVLPVKETRSSTNKKLFRDPQYRVLGGVCAGMAKFFSVQVWMIRLLFIAPFLFGLLSIEQDGPIWNTGISLNGMSVLVYLVFWILTPLAKTGTDFMLLNGEPVNLSTIQQANQVERENVQSTGWMTPLLRGIAYVLLGLLLLVLVPIVFSMGLGTFLAYRAADFLLFSTLHKSLAFLVLSLVFILPLLVLLFGIIRRLAGYAKPAVYFRKTVLGLHVLGWLAAAILVYSLLQQHHTISRKKQEFTYAFTGDTLRVMPMEMDTVQTDDLFSVRQPNSLIQATGNQYRCRTVWVNFHRSDDSVVKVRIVRRASGSNEEDALGQIERFELVPAWQDGQLFIPRQFLLSNESSYHFQHAQVDVYVPAHIPVQAHRVFRNSGSQRVQIGFNSGTFNAQFHEQESLDDVLRIGDSVEMEGHEEVDLKIQQSLDSLKTLRRQLKSEKRQALEEIDRAIEQANKRLGE
ncbi:MAG: PspC domain-containing protein [Chitinophagaceae bacterium]